MGNHPTTAISEKKRRVLIFRLSSLGDVILATAALTALPEGVLADWVVKPEYAEILRGHPRIGQIIEFDRARGLSGWIKLCQELARRDYERVFDLHSTLRTRIAYFVFAAGGQLRRDGQDVWRTVSKQRWKFMGYFALKRFWPKSWKPRSFVVRFAEIVGGTGNERPDLRHLLVSAPGEELSLQRLPTEEFLAVMPSSRWPGKKWPVRNFFLALKNQSVLPVILGGKNDEESYALVRMFETAGIRHRTEIGQLGLKQTAQLLARASAYIGCDTGLAHLAEAVGTRAVIIYGPTTADLGFGPWRPESRAVESALWCRPCSKDGRACFRLGENRFACMKGLSPETVTKALRSVKSD